MKSSIIILTALLGIIESSNCWTFETGENCGYLHSRSGDKKLDIRLGQIITDLNNLYLNQSDAWGDVAVFVEVRTGCSISLCSEPYLQANCQQVVNNTVFENKIVSASCTCKTNCEGEKCSKIKLNGSQECARAFIHKGCNVCSGIYLDMNIGNISSVGTYAESNLGIHSLVVKPGCSLFSYDERDFDGVQQTFQSGFHNDVYGRQIESYRCVCTEPETYDVPNRPITYPLQISIPDTAESIITKLSSESVKNHKGLLRAIESLENRRSARNAYVMVLGMTGAGKSASINFLFGNRSIAEIGEAESVTSQINEYIFPVPVNELGISNSELHIIDTPGLGDTRGLTHDAQFLATLENYLANHQDLKSRIPNVVLVFAKFTENRFSGGGANFVRMLRGLDLLSNKLYAKKFSNVVIVLTHYMSESAIVTKNPAAKIALFKKVVEDHSLFPKPIMITVAENRPEDEELPMINGYYRLPTGELYPKNVFDSFQQLTQSGGDPIGYAILKTAFQNPEALKMSQNVKTLLNASDPNVQRYLNLLTSANFKIEDTEVSTVLSKVYNNDTYFTPEIRSRYPDTLPYIQRVLNTRNIFRLDNVPRTRGGIIRLLKDIRKTPATTTLLKKALGLEAPLFERPLLVGSGFNLLTEVTLSSSAIQLGSNNKMFELGYLIPTGINSKIEKAYVTVNDNFETSTDFYKTKLTGMGISISSVNINRLTGKIATNESSLRISQEMRVFKFELNDNVILAPVFIETVKKLPPFTTHNQLTLDQWKKFFSQFGTHVVQSAYGGGVLEVHMDFLGSISPTKEILKTNSEKMVEFAACVTAGRICHNFDSNFTISLHGGNSNIRTINTKNYKHDEMSKLIEDWKDSLSVEPIMIDSSIQLVPISEIAKGVSPESGIQVSGALTTLLNSPNGLVYTPDPEILRLERERAEEAARIAAAKLAEEQRLAAAKLAEEKRLEAERKQEEELKRQLEEKRLELERIQKEVDAERKKQQEAFAALQKKIEAENAKKRAEEERELKRIAEEHRKERERIAEVQRVEAARVEAERQRAEAAKTEEQRRERERVERERAAQRQRQIEAEQALQRQIEAERAAAQAAASAAAAQKAEADLIASLQSGCPRDYHRRKRSISNSTRKVDIFPVKTNSKYSTIISKFLNDELNVITFDEVEKHNQETDFWVVLFDRVYDVTNFVEKHPGGKMVMLPYAGDDASLAFETAGHGKMEKLEPYLIGILPIEERYFESRYVFAR